MTTPAPTVWVYVWLRDAVSGAAYWQRYTFVGTDHADAVKQATRYLRPSDVLGIESYDGEPRTWRLDSEVTENVSS